MPQDAAPVTMASVARHLSLPQLQEHFKKDHATAKFVWDSFRGHDTEPVEAKNKSNVIKSITAFKSLPRSMDADVQDAEFLQWMGLLVKEVVMCAETDAKCNNCYPKNCTINCGCSGQVNAARRLHMQSFKIPFPPQRLSISEQISHLMEKIPAKIIQREGGSNIKKGAAINGSATATQKRVRLVPIGVCATEMDEEANKHGSIANFFSSLKPSDPAVKEERTSTDSAKLTQSAKEGTDGQPHFLQQKEPSTGNSTTSRVNAGDEGRNEDTDL